MIIDIPKIYNVLKDADACKLWKPRDRIHEKFNSTVAEAMYEEPILNGAFGGIHWRN